MKKILALLLMAICLTGCGDDNHPGTTSLDTTEDTQVTSEVNENPPLRFGAESNDFMNVSAEDKIEYDSQELFLIGSLETFEIALQTFPEEHQTEITELCTEVIGENLEFFETSSLILSPFQYSSSETDIELKEIRANVETNELELDYELYSPEFVDWDLQIRFFLIVVEKAMVETLDNPKLKITIYNLRDESNKSSYYGA